MTARLLTLCRSVDRQLWSYQHPLRQFGKYLSHEILNKIENRKMDLHRLNDMSADEIGEWSHDQSHDLIVGHMTDHVILVDRLHGPSQDLIT